VGRTEVSWRQTMMEADIGGEEISM